jgi:hypothetical protein
MLSSTSDAAAQLALMTLNAKRLQYRAKNCKTQASPCSRCTSNTLREVLR